MDYMDYRKTLGIGFNDKEKQKLFVNRIELLFHNNHMYFSKTLEEKFCYWAGIKLLDGTEKCRFDTHLSSMWSYLEPQKRNFLKFLFSLTILINIYDASVLPHNKILPYVRIALTDSDIPFEIIEDDEGVFILPKGAKELDDKLVNEPLQWLVEYPQARTAWIKALKFYADATNKNASDCADLFRKALEQFFREFFGGKKSLENYRSGYGNFMENHGIPAELSNSFEKVLNQYTTYMNNYAKHGNGTSKIALEYIMYQTGSLIRFLITLKQEEK